MTTPASVTDGRSARSQRTRQAVVDALLVLIREGQPRPTAREIAERANISLRSVYVHFDDLEDLFLAAAERQMAVVASLIEPISPDLPLAQRIDAMCALRARIFEEVGPVRRAAELQAPFSHTLSELLIGVRTTSREAISSLFAAELDRLPVERRRMRLGALDAVMSAESWDLLRRTHEMSVAEARATMTEAATMLLGGSS